MREQYLDLLGLPRNASAVQIKQRLDEEEKKWHHRRQTAPTPERVAEYTQIMRDLADARRVLLSGEVPTSAVPLPPGARSSQPGRRPTQPAPSATPRRGTPMPPPPPPPPAPVGTDDLWLGHCIRFLVIGFVLSLACYPFLVGYLWLIFILRATGRRGRDLFLFIVPVVGLVITVQTVWRYTAKSVYWTPRPDLQSKPLFGPAYPMAPMR